GMVAWTFGELIIIDITLYGAALFLEYIALIRLRKLAAQEHRPFKIPLNIFGLTAMALLPLSVYVIAMTGAFLNSERALKPGLFGWSDPDCRPFLFWPVAFDTGTSGKR